MACRPFLLYPREADAQHVLRLDGLQLYLLTLGHACGDDMYESGWARL